MDKVHFSDKQELTLGDTTAVQDYTEQEFMQLVREFLTEDDLVIAGFAVEAQSPAAFAVDLKIDSDLGWALAVDPQTGKPIRMKANTEVDDFQAADPSYGRIDVVAVRRTRNLSSAESRTFWDEGLGQTYEQSTYTRDLDDVEVVVIQGDATTSPTAPTTYGGDPITDNYIILAEVSIGAGATTITGGDITDKREMYSRPKMTDGAITVNQLGPNSVTNAKLGAAAVTNAKVADYTLENDKLEGVRRGRFDLNSSYQDLWSGDTKDWLDRYALIYLAHQPMATLNELKALVDLTATETDYSLGTLSGQTVYVKVDGASNRLEFKLGASTLSDVYIRVEDAGANA